MYTMTAAPGYEQSYEFTTYDLRSVSTTRVHGPSWRPENSGAFFDTRQLGPW